MNPTATVPVKVSPEAAARAAELGMRAELEQMIQFVRRSAPGLQRIDVEVEERSEEGDPPGVTVWATIPPSYELDRAFSRATSDWMVEQFPPLVNQHFAILTHYGEAHAG